MLFTRHWSLLRIHFQATTHHRLPLPSQLFQPVLPVSPAQARIRTHNPLIRRLGSGSPLDLNPLHTLDFASSILNRISKCKTIIDRMKHVFATEKTPIIGQISNFILSTWHERSFFQFSPQELYNNVIAFVGFKGTKITKNSSQKEREDVLKASSRA